MLQFELIDPDKITVTVTSPDALIIDDDDQEVRELGNILKSDEEEYKFHTTPKKYFHALWWIKEGDLEMLKEKLIDLNSD